MKVENLINDRGNKAANQFVIYDDNGNVEFQSYDSLIARVSGNREVILFPNWDYSQTTMKHLYIFLREFASWLNIDRKPSIEKAIKSGQIKLAN